jgi:O-antigen ligase
MTPHIAIVGCALAIALLFRLSRDRVPKTSIALWIPVAWFLIAGSRNVATWLQLNGSVEAADRYLEGSPVDRAVLAGLMVCGIVALLGRGRRVKAILGANVPILAYFLYCGISILWSDYPSVTSKRWMRSLGDVVMILVILTDPQWRAAFRRVLTRVAFLLLPISILLIKYYPELGRAYSEGGIPSWIGVATGKNSLGMTCLIFGLACLSSFLAVCRAPKDSDRLRRLTAYGAVVAMAVWLVWKADSKTSLACFVLVSSLMIALSHSSYVRKPAVLLAMVTALVSVSFAVLFLGVGGGAIEAMGRDSTLTGRTEIWKVALGFAQNPWIGAGYDSFWLGSRLDGVARALHVSVLNQSHNGYIEVYLSLGWIGVALLAGLIVTGYRRIIAGFRGDLEVSTLRIAYFVVALAYNFTEGVFKTMSPVWIAFLLATMAVPQVRALKARTFTSEVPEVHVPAGVPEATVHP